MQYFSSKKNTVKFRNLYELERNDLANLMRKLLITTLSICQKSHIQQRLPPNFSLLIPSYESPKEREMIHLISMPVKFMNVN